MRPTHMKKLVLSLTLALTAAAAHAQAPATATPAAPATPGAPAAPAAPAKPLGLADKKFIKDLSENILVEQKFLALIVDNKTGTYNDETKRTTGTMNGELKKIWTGLATLAQTKGAEVAQEVSKSDLAKIQRLGKEKADKFEKEFFKDLGKETARTMKLLDTAKTLQDPDVKLFAEDWGTVIKGHDKAVAGAEKAASGKK